MFSTEKVSHYQFFTFPRTLESKRIFKLIKIDLKFRAVWLQQA
jgi:hypothetical protein